jgi:hypothetical protein
VTVTDGRRMTVYEGNTIDDRDEYTDLLRSALNGHEF